MSCFEEVGSEGGRVLKGEEGGREKGDPEIWKEGRAKKNQREKRKERKKRGSWEENSRRERKEVDLSLKVLDFLK